LDPDEFLGALTELAEGLPLNFSAAAPGVRLLNLALMNNEPLTKIVLAISAVEALGQDETWTEAQIDLIKKLAAEVEEGAGNQDEERLEVAEALRRSLHRISLRQGVMRVLSRLGLSDLRDEWDRVYGLRSSVFHGSCGLDDNELRQLADETIALCAKIILALIKRHGIKLPSVAKRRFPDA
jgi:hypothetical protein